MGRAWPQTIPIGEQPRRCQAKNPECFMVAARNPWDAPRLKLLQKYKYKLNIIEINVRIDIESFCFHIVSCPYLILIYIYQTFKCLLHIKLT